jgi:16S rRNA C967 or C1407 C5-methylase (RsmB/RsmF family)
VQDRLACGQLHGVRGHSRAFRDGLIEVQDEGSQLVALLAGARPGMIVVDYCAGAGGKTLALAAAMGRQGRLRGTLWALDVEARFLKRPAPAPPTSCWSMPPVPAAASGAATRRPAPG